MKRTLWLIICVALLVQCGMVVGAETASDTGEVRFQSLLNSLSSDSNNQILIWTEDIDYDVVEQVTFMKTGLSREMITDEVGIDEVQNYINV